MFATLIARNYSGRATLRMPKTVNATAAAVQSAPKPAPAQPQTAAKPTQLPQSGGRRLSGRSPLRTPW